MADKKTTRKSSLLTPCRSVGLKRKSLGTPIKSITAEKSENTPTSVSITKEPTSITPLNLSNTIPIVSKKLKLDIDPEPPKPALLDLPKPTEIPMVELTVAELDTQISETRANITKKTTEIEELESDLLNMKQHDLEALNNLTSKWRTAAQDALNELLAEYKNQGKACSMLTLLETLGITPQLVHYSESETDFY